MGSCAAAAGVSGVSLYVYLYKYEAYWVENTGEAPGSSYLGL